MIALPGMKSLRVLSLGRNQIRRIEKLEDVAETLEELWLSYNLITSLSGINILRNLTTLYMSNNKISNWSEIQKLVFFIFIQSALPNLRDVLFTGNPIYDGMSKEEARLKVLKLAPQLKKIDGDLVTPADIEEAAKID